MILIQDALRRCFAIDDFLNFAAIEAGPLSSAWRMDVRTGSNFYTWCLKRHRIPTSQRLRFETSLPELFRDLGFGLIPQIVPTSGGGLWFEFEGGAYSAHAWVQQDYPVDWLIPGMWGPPHCQAAGAILAHFHNTGLQVRRYLPPGWEPAAAPINVDLVDVWNKAFANAERELPDHDMIRHIVKKARDPVLQTVQLLKGRLAQDAGMPAVLVHGDYHPGNVLFQGGRPIALVDLDYVQMQPVMYDVGYAAYMFGRSGNGASSGEGSLDADKVSAFVHGYNEVALSSPLGQFVPRMDAEVLNAYLHLGAFLVGYWLLDAYVAKAEARSAIALPLTQTLFDCSRTIEPWRGKLYI